MWIFTRYGFFSSVCARQGDGGHDQPVDPDRLMIRARVKSHLEAVKTGFPEQLAEIEIIETTSTDYRYRMFVDKRVWQPVLAAMVEEMDYDNFKARVADHQGSEGAAYSHSLHDVWTVMNRLQQ